jgi:ribosomal protein L34E
MEKEICNECGNSVKFGSGLFVNRVHDFNNYSEKIKMKKPFPEGGYICIECEEKIRQLVCWK